MKNIIFTIILILTVLAWLDCYQNEQEYLEDIRIDEMYIPENDIALTPNKQ